MGHALNLNKSMHVQAQVLEKVGKVGKQRDYLVLNFGLHFSESYREELEVFIGQASLPSLLSATF